MTQGVQQIVESCIMYEIMNVQLISKQAIEATRMAAYFSYPTKFVFILCFACDVIPFL